MADQEENISVEDLDIDEYELIPDPQPIKDLDVIKVKREDVRGLLAVVFLIGFFFILLAGIFIAAINEGNKVESLTAVLLSISGILSGPLGFVIGYYFRSKDQE